MSKSTSCAEGGWVIPAAMAACAAVLGLRRSGELEDTDAPDSALAVSESFVVFWEEGVLGEIVLCSGELGEETGLGDWGLWLGSLGGCGTRRSRSRS